MPLEDALRFMAKSYPQIRVGQLWALTYLGRHASKPYDRTSLAMANQIGVTLDVVRRTMDQLEASGLVVQGLFPGKVRLACYALTPKGADVVQAMRENMRSDSNS